MGCCDLRWDRSMYKENIRAYVKLELEILDALISEWTPGFGTMRPRMWGASQGFYLEKVLLC